MTRFIHWRKMTWAIVLWSGALGAWIGVVALTATDVARACATDSAGIALTALTRQECVAGAGLGTGASALAIGLLWLLGVVALGAMWFMTRPLWRHGRGARLRRIRPDQVPSLYAESSFLRKPDTGHSG